MAAGILLFALGVTTFIYILPKDTPIRVWICLGGAVLCAIGVLLFLLGLRKRVGIEDVTRAINYVDTLSGEEFEVFCARLLEVEGFEQIELNGSSGDQGADIIAKHGDKRYAIQCKHRLDPYKTKYGNKPIQEVHASLGFYCCDAGFVITNGYFTKGGTDAAAVTEVLLWDRDKIISILKKL